MGAGGVVSDGLSAHTGRWWRRWRRGRTGPARMDGGRAAVRRCRRFSSLRGAAASRARTGSIPPAWTNSGLDSWDRMADVGLAGRPQVADQRRPLALEDRHQAGVGALDRLLEHDVGLVESGRRPVAGVVADLDAEGRTGGHVPARRRCAGQRAGGHGRQAGRWSWSSSSAAAAFFVAGGPPRAGPRRHRRRRRTTATPASGVPLGSGRTPSRWRAELAAGQDGRCLAGRRSRPPRGGRRPRRRASGSSGWSVRRPASG